MNENTAMIQEHPMPRLHVVGHVVALVLVCLGADPVHADMIPSPGISLTLLFENVTDYPNYDFYVKHEADGRPHWGGLLDKVEPGKVIRLTGRRDLGHVFLIAVPRGQVIEAPKEHKEGWLHNAPAGGLQSQPLKGDDAGFSLNVYSGYDVAYRVRIEDNRLEVDWVKSSLSSETILGWIMLFVCGLACLSIPATIIAVPILVARWTRRSPPQKNSTR